MKYLEENQDLSETLIKIQKDLGFSEFILKKTIEKLRRDLQRFHLADSFQLIESESTLTLQIDGRYSGRKILGKYLEESLSIKMVVTLFKKEFKSVEDFAEKNFISYSVAYNTLQILNREGKEYGLSANRGTIFDRENLSSSCLCTLFSLADTDYREVYTFKVIAQTEKIFQAVTENYTLTNYEKKQLFHYIAIELQVGRIARVVDKEYRYFSDEALNEIRLLLPPQLEDLDYHLLSWLFVNNKLEQVDVAEEIDNEIVQLSHTFLEKFEERYGKLKPELAFGLAQGLSRLHVNILYRSINIFDPLEVNLEFFRQHWSEFYLFSTDYVDSIVREYPKLLKFREYLFFNYLMLLIDMIPIESLTAPIRVLIDFSYGENYNRFIQAQLLSTIKINLVVVDSIEQADLVITNENDLYKASGLETVVWSDMPKTIDWLTLKERLSSIQEKNLCQQV